MAEILARGVAEEGITNIRVRNVAYTSQSYLLRDCWRYKGIILVSCSYDRSIFPPMGFLLKELDHQSTSHLTIAVF